MTAEAGSGLAGSTAEKTLANVRKRFRKCFLSRAFCGRGVKQVLTNGTNETGHMRTQSSHITELSVSDAVHGSVD